LPLHKQLTEAKLPGYRKNEWTKKPVVVYSSRLDKEKNPFFMMQVAEEFLKQNENWEWHVTTSGKSFKSMLPGVIEAMNELADRQPRFKLLSNLTKEEYYTELADAKIQFNSSLQDYVSWTVLESTTFGCDVIFPDFRSFPEFVPADKLYKPFNLQSALYVLNQNRTSNRTGIYYNYPDLADLGRRMEAYIIANDVTQEINVWHESAYCTHLLNTQGIHE
jgi:glycosyltransferase involved in cell wall biosynthesis